jgi:hypothetical protein
MRQAFVDAQAAMGFVVSQTSHIEAKVYDIKFTSIQYEDILGGPEGCIDTSANPWSKSVTYYSSENFGAAKWLDGNAGDVPYGSSERTKYETEVATAGRGYEYGLEEINQAYMLGIPLEAERVRGAMRAYQELVDGVALIGDSAKGFTGLFNNASVPQAAVATVSSATTWAAKLALGSGGPQAVLADVNAAITLVQTQTNTVQIADTLLLPYSRFNVLASTQLPNTDMTLLEFIRKSNVYTANTGRPLTIRSVRGLDTAGSGGTARMVAFRKDPEVVKLHIPMPMRFLPVQVQGVKFRVPGIFRLGGLDVRLPKEMTYLDGL